MSRAVVTRVAFALLVAGALFALAERGVSGRQAHPAAGRVTNSATVLADLPGEVASAPAPRQAASAEQARPQARRFIRAFLLYQERVEAPRSRALFERTAADWIRRRLWAAPPAGAPRRGRLIDLHLYGPLRGTVKAAALVAYDRPAIRSSFEFALRPRRGTWRVTTLYP